MYWLALIHWEEFLLSYPVSQLPYLSFSFLYHYKIIDFLIQCIINHSYYFTIFWDKILLCINVDLELKIKFLLQIPEYLDLILLFNT